MGIEEFKEQEELQFRTQKQSQSEYKPVQATRPLSDIAERDAADGRLEKLLKDFQDDKPQVKQGKQENKENLIDTKADEIIKNHKKIIEDVADKFGVDKYIIAGVIYKEQASLDFFDNFDATAAFGGVDTSIGLGQVKVSTAKKVEDGKYIEGITRKEIQDAGGESNARIARLKNNKWNIKYVGAYLSYLQNIRKVEFPEISSRPDILATVYNIGKEEAHSNPKPNDYGKDVKRLYGHMKELIG